MLKPFLDLNWRWLFAELVIVFVGLFAALQFDEWREQQELYEAETRYLQRLETDLRDYVVFHEQFVSILEANFRAVKHANDSLAAGEVLNGDEELFEFGLLRVQMLPSMSIPSAAYDEMVASGMFVRMRSEPLKQALASMYAQSEWTERNFQWWRQGALNLERDLAPYVEYAYDYDTMSEDAAFIYEEPMRSVRFDFEGLRADPQVRGGFYWAVDTHSDWIGQYERVGASLAAALEALERELAER